MSYESDCDDYAIFGNPERDHYDYELAAEYDRWDGHREDFDYDEPDDCHKCYNRNDCNTCRGARLYSEAWRIEAVAQGWLDYPKNDDIPF